MHATTVVVPWRNRPEIEQTLAANLAFFGVDVAVLVVNYGGDERMLAPIVDRLADPRLRTLSLQAESFNKSIALNAGIEAAETDSVFTLDADVILVEFDFSQATAAVAQGHWVTLGRVAESTPDGIDPGQIAQLAYSMEIVLADGRRTRVETSRRFFEGDARSCPGIVYARRDDLLAIDGYHSELIGWGWEDIDLQVRLGFLGLNRVELGYGQHLTHGNEIRHVVGSSAADDNRRNQKRCMMRYDAGNFHGTLRQDVAKIRESGRVLSRPARGGHKIQTGV